jgi:hypothetical protein
VTSIRAATLRERPVPVGLLFPCMSNGSGVVRTRKESADSWSAWRVRRRYFDAQFGSACPFLRERDFVTNMLRVMRYSDARARVYV